MGRTVALIVGILLGALVLPFVLGFAGVGTANG